MTGRPLPEVAITGVGPMVCGLTAAEALDPGTASAAADQREGWLDGWFDGWFDVNAHLGPKGHKYLAPATRYLLAAAAAALRDSNLTGGHYAPEEAGVAAATNFGAHGTLAAMDAVILGAGAEELQPMTAPNFSVNLAASQLSIKHRWKAFNLTVTTAVTAGLEAAQVASRALGRGRAKMVLCGATEDEAPALASEFLGGRLRPGACALVLEDLTTARARGARVQARLRGVTLRFCSERRAGGPGQLAERLVSAMAPLLPEGRSILRTCFGRVPFPLEESLAEAQARLAGSGRVLVRERSPFDRPSVASVSPLLQLAALVVRRQSGLVLAAGPHGSLAVAALTGADA